MLATLGLTWQRTIINNLKKTQIPQNEFTNFQECIEGDGLLLEVIGDTYGCLSGKVVGDSNGKPRFKAFYSFNAKSLPRILERRIGDNKNTVINNVGATKDLVEFLENDYWGCQTKGEYEIVKELPDRFALMKYGCTGDGLIGSPNPPMIIGIKLADGWSLISSAKNNINNKGQPSCLLVDIFKISKKLTSQCFENTNTSVSKIRDVQYP